MHFAQSKRGRAYRDRLRQIRRQLVEELIAKPEPRHTAADLIVSSRNDRDGPASRRNLNPPQTFRLAHHAVIFGPAGRDSECDCRHESEMLR